MDNFLIIFLTWCVFTLIIDAITFGSIGYIIFKLLKGNDKYWYVGAVITSIVFLCWDGYISGNIVKKLDFSIGNEVILKFLNYDIEKVFEVTPFNIIVVFIQMFIGFKIGQIMIKRILSATTKLT